MWEKGVGILPPRACVLLLGRKCNVFSVLTKVLRPSHPPLPFSLAVASETLAAPQTHRALYMLLPPPDLPFSSWLGGKRLLTTGDAPPAQASFSSWRFSQMDLSYLCTPSHRTSQHYCTLFSPLSSPEVNRDSLLWPSTWHPDGGQCMCVQWMSSVGAGRKRTS